MYSTKEQRIAQIKRELDDYQKNGNPIMEVRYRQTELEIVREIPEEEFAKLNDSKEYYALINKHGESRNFKLG